MANFLSLPIPEVTLVEINIIYLAANDLFKKESYSEAGKYYDKIYSILQNLSVSVELEKGIATLESYKSRNKISRIVAQQKSADTKNMKSLPASSIENKDYYLIQKNDNIDILKARFDICKQSMDCKKLSKEVLQALYTSNILVDLASKLSKLISESEVANLIDLKILATKDINIVKTSEICFLGTNQRHFIEALTMLEWSLNENHQLVLLNEKPKNSLAKGLSKSELISKRRIKVLELLRQIKNS
ncbi:hypothetical protein BB561_000554 [Smittium simulii]|uniref:Uncharacterized protein n=1 Tax=Smittium simulii TaxID=133385 RepID=A0A2T9YYN2_9FUNG|nr:hypothetical protein BB561_000554 [Smittium simulii]